MSKEALKLALEALEYPGNVWHMDCPRNAAITAIKEALADQCVCGEPDTPGTHRTDGPCLAEQPAQQQKPVAIVADHPERIDWLREEPPDGTLLYTSPQPSKPWVGLTRDERMDIINRFAGQDWVYAVEAIETKLREKNA